MIDRRILLFTCGLLAVASGMRAASAQSGRVRATWDSLGALRPVPRAVVFLDGGAACFVAADVEGARFSLFSSFALGSLPAAVWSDASPAGSNGVTRVAAARWGGVLAGIAQVPLSPGSNQRITTVYCYRPTSSRPLWSHSFSGASISGAALAVSPAGDLIVAARARPEVSAVELAALEPATAQVLASLLVPADGLRELLFSTSGNALMLVGRLEDYLIDPASWTFERIARHGASTPARALGADGSLVLSAEIGSVELLERGAAGYSRRWSEQLGQRWVGIRAALSEDGSLAAVALWDTTSPGTVQLAVYESAGGRRLWSRLLQSSSSEQNLPVALRFCADASRLAYAGWGDPQGAIDEVYLLDAASGAVRDSIDLPGSPYDLAFSRDGHRLAIASKSNHANHFGRGGRVTIYDAEDLELDVGGAPRLGATVDLIARIEPGMPVLYACGSPAAHPLILPGLGGELLLDPASLWLLGSSSAGASGEARLPLAIPADPFLLGGRMHFQCLSATAFGRLRFSALSLALSALP